MSGVVIVLLIGAGIILVIDLIIGLIGWTFYKDALEAEEKNENRQISSWFIRITTLSIIIFITIVGLFFSLAVGVGTSY